MTATGDVEVSTEAATRRRPEANNPRPGHVLAVSGKKDGAAAGSGACFHMPLHYPRYSSADYETMPEWKLDRLLTEYGLPAAGDVAQKRSFAMGAFLWGSR